MADEPPDPEPGFELAGPWPETIAGRPSLAQLGQQLQELLQSILTLPRDPDLYRGDDRAFLAAEIKARLIPRLAVAPLGRHRDVFRQYFFSGPDAERRLWLLASVGRESAGLRPIEELEAEEIRDTTFRLLYEACASAVSESYAKRVLEVPWIPPEITERRGRAVYGWGEDETEGSKGA